MTVKEFLSDPGSATLSFKQLAPQANYGLEVLYQQLDDFGLMRMVKISIDDLPVLLGFSQANLSAPTFVDILNNSGVIPIGVKLFAKDSGIIRKTLQIDQIKLDKVSNNLIKEQLINQGYDEDLLIYVRTSIFAKDHEVMTLVEYALPGLQELLNNI